MEKITTKAALARLKEVTGKTQKQIAEMGGINDKQMSAYFRGVYEMKLSMFTKLCSDCGVNPSEVLSHFELLSLGNLNVKS